MTEDNLPVDSTQTGIETTDQDTSPYTLLINAFFEGDAHAAIHLAAVCEERLPHDTDPDDPSDPLPYLVPAIRLWGEGMQAALSMNASGANESYKELAQVIATAPAEARAVAGLEAFWQSLEATAAIGEPMTAAGEASMLGSLDVATRALNRAGPVVKDVMRIAMDEAADPWLQAVSMGLLNGYFIQGALLHMQNVARGSQLRPAQRFFADMGAQITDLNQKADLEPEGHDLFRSFGYVARSAEMRVKAEVEMEAGNYDKALQLFDDMSDLLSRASTEMPAVAGPAAITAMFDKLREAFWNMSGSVGRSTKLLQRTKELQLELEAALSQNADARAAHARREADHQRMLEKFAQRALHVNVENKSINTIETEVINQIDIRTEISHSVNDWAADQVLELLGKIPASPEAEAAKKAAQEAKSEDDLAKKLAKMAKVIESSGKLIDAAAGFVPYGKPVLAALKGLYAGFQALRAPDDAPVGGGDPTVVT